MSNRPKAVLHRMVMPGHTCPYGLKSLDLLRRRGFEVEDHHLTTRAETDAFKAAHGVKTFFLYGVMSGVTTLIFWGFEFGFDALFGTDAARYTGAVIGLAIGYAAKYFLDKNVTFQGPREEPA